MFYLDLYFENYTYANSIVTQVPSNTVSPFLGFAYNKIENILYSIVQVEVTPVGRYRLYISNIDTNTTTFVPFSLTEKQISACPIMYVHQANY